MLNVEAQGPVLHITLNRPEVRNAFNEELIAALTQAFTDLPEETRIVVLAGEGKAFCAGGDLQWMQRAALYSEEENKEDARRLARLYRAVMDCPCVVVANVHGAVFGGGLGLLAASDYAIADPNTVFAFSEVKLGLVPATISSVVIPKIGHGYARAYFATGIQFTAQTALRMGLVHEVSTESHLVLEQLTREVLKGGPKAIATSKRIAQQPPMSPEDAGTLLAQVRAGEEAQEGIRAFLEKRSASFVVGQVW
jgi:enoyl-CoA hydratase/carnithine racemase